MVKQPFPTRASEPSGPRYTPSSTFQVAEDIIPIAELKARLSETVRSLEDRARPLVVTLNGKPAAVVMSPRAYDRLVYHQRVADAVNEGLADIEAGRVISHEEMKRRVERRYGSLRKKRK